MFIVCTKSRINKNNDVKNIFQYCVELAFALKSEIYLFI